MASKIEGSIVSVTDDGSLVTDITEEQLSATPRDDRATVACEGHETHGVFPPDHQQPPMTFVAFLDADRRLNLAIVGESAHLMLGLKVGAPVVVEW